MKSDEVQWEKGRFKEQFTKQLVTIIKNGNQEQVTLEDMRRQLRKLLKLSKYQ